MSKTLVQEQFGKTAASYLTSTPHALGKSLERLVTLTAPQKDWRTLDVATGGGHVAYTFAPHVARVWATDITQEMLDMVKTEAAKRGLDNVRTAYAKAEALPFEDASFDLVICREVLEHLTVLQVKQAVANMVRMTSAFIYVTTRFHPSPANLLDFTTQFDVDPSHITLLNKDLLRLMFVLEGCRSRPDLEARMDWGDKGRVLVLEKLKAE